jgi:hypothetical protein
MRSNIVQTLVMFTAWALLIHARGENIGWGDWTDIGEDGLSSHDLQISEIVPDVLVDSYWIIEPWRERVEYVNDGCYHQVVFYVCGEKSKPDPASFCIGIGDDTATVTVWVPISGTRQVSDNITSLPLGSNNARLTTNWGAWESIGADGLSSQRLEKLLSRFLPAMLDRGRYFLPLRKRVRVVDKRFHQVEFSVCGIDSCELRLSSVTIYAVPRSGTPEVSDPRSTTVTGHDTPDVKPWVTEQIPVSEEIYNSPDSSTTPEPGYVKPNLLDRAISFISRIPNMFWSAWVHVSESNPAPAAISALAGKLPSDLTEEYPVIQVLKFRNRSVGKTVENNVEFKLCRDQTCNDPLTVNVVLDEPMDTNPWRPTIITITYNASPDY